VRAIWHLWLDTARPGWQNMAIDQALLERAQTGERWLRLYTWQPGCLSFGRHEPAARRYDAGRIAALGLDVVRRPSGGRAVWHGRELTYAVACPGGIGSLRDSYLEIHRMLRDALAGIGVAAELAPTSRAAPVDAGACFARPAGGELMVAGRKIVGSAQLRQGGALLQHGSIRLADDQAVVSAVTCGDTAPLETATALRDAGDDTIATDSLTAAVATAAERRWGGTWRHEAPTDDVVAGSERHAARFRSTEWTWSPTR
jgi:lipoyl(octanoyl) transferase